MSQQLLAAVGDLSKRVKALEGKAPPTVGALEAITQALADLTRRVHELEQKRGPGRPKKHG